MLRKTPPSGIHSPARRIASMRPQRNAAENWVMAKTVAVTEEASMRPQRNAAENAGT